MIENTQKKSTLIRIIVPIVLIMVIVGIWFAKNNANKLSQAPASANNPDFELISQTLDLDVLKSYGLPIMIDFGSDDCAPCKAMEPVLIDAHAQYQGKVIIKFYDVWKEPSFGEGFPLEVIPTQFFFTADGKPFVPSESTPVQMQVYSKKDTNEHVYTVHQGGLTKEQIDAIFAEMGALLEK